jgi:hypothetical protein
VVTARCRVELAELAADGVGVLVEAHGRAASGQDGGVVLEVRPPLFGQRVEDPVAVLVGERVPEAVVVEPVVVVHDDTRDRLDAPVDLPALRPKAPLPHMPITPIRSRSTNGRVPR